MVDFLGNDYAPTYLRRAKGLVKTGRARWAEGCGMTKICLTEVPARKKFEEELKVDIFDNDGNKVVESAVGEPVLTVGYILAQMEKVRADNEHIVKALNDVISIETHAPVANAADFSGQAKAEAVADIVKCRETTNQKLLGMYEKMYDGLTGAKSSRDLGDVKAILDSLPHMPESLLGSVTFADQIGSAISGLIAQAARK